MYDASTLRLAGAGYQPQRCAAGAIRGLNVVLSVDEKQCCEKWQS
jgi:hypothetical protein